MPNRLYHTRTHLKIVDKKIKIKVKDIQYEIYSGSGIFSKDRLDIGTKILIENCIIKDNWSVLDLGCGIGVIGINHLFIERNSTFCAVVMTMLAVFFISIIA